MNSHHQVKKAKVNKDTNVPEIAEIQTNDGLGHGDTPSVPCKNVPTSRNKNNQTEISNIKKIQLEELGHGRSQFSASLDANINKIQPNRVGHGGKLPSTPIDVSFDNNNKRNENEKYATNWNNNNRNKPNSHPRLKNVLANKDSDGPEIAEI